VHSHWTSQENVANTFAAFSNSLNLTYESEEDYLQRIEVFNETLQFIEVFNNNNTEEPYYVSGGALACLCSESV